jgi:hypothetical protein
MPKYKGPPRRRPSLTTPSLKRPSLKRDVRPTIQHLRSVIENRKRVQEIALELLILIREHESLLADDPFHRRLVMLCAGATFSLWRAVPLVHVNRDERDVSVTADYLEQVVRHNAINYGDDDRARAFSFGFYMSNARYRISACCSEAVYKKWPEAKKALRSRGLLGRVTGVREPGYDAVERVGEYIAGLRVIVDALKD